MQQGAVKRCDRGFLSAVLRGVDVRSCRSVAFSPPRLIENALRAHVAKTVGVPKMIARSRFHCRDRRR
jgi:hypothetical protein